MSYPGKKWMSYQICRPCIIIQFTIAAKYLLGMRGIKIYTFQYFDFQFLNSSYQNSVIDNPVYSHYASLNIRP